MNKVLELHAKRWFDRKNGNTYFSAVALYNGEEIKRIDYEYGYGDQWLDSITTGLVVNQISRPNDLVPWKFLEELRKNGVFVVDTCHDVTRKKDL